MDGNRVNQDLGEADEDHQTARNAASKTIELKLSVARDPSRVQWLMRNNRMNCRVKDELVKQLSTLNSKLNLLSPDLVYGDAERAEVQTQREKVQAELKLHNSKGHQGKSCPAGRYPNQN